MSTDHGTTEPWASYAAAAAASGVVVRELLTLRTCRRLPPSSAEIWGTPDKPPMSAELLRAMGKAESYVAGAFDAEHPEAGMVGVCVGFHSTPAARAMHSHIAGVTDAVAGRHVGFALKLHQRAWCLDRGIDLTEWTFDPLVSRNAYFNLAKLGARVAEYLPDFYGSMTDAINRGNDSDRILVHWSLASPEVAQACAGSPVRATRAARRRRLVGARPARHRGAAAHRSRAGEASGASRCATSWRPPWTPAAHVAGFDKGQGYLVLPHEGDLP